MKKTHTSIKCYSICKRERKRELNMYQYVWEQDMGRIMMNEVVVGSEQDQSCYEPYYYFRQHYDEVPTSAWNFELPLTKGTVVDTVESSSISSSSADSYSSSQRCNDVPSSYSDEKHNSSSDFQPPPPPSHADVAASDVLIFHQHYSQQHHINNKLLMGDDDDEYDATDHEKPLQICFQTNQDPNSFFKLVDEKCLKDEFESWNAILETNLTGKQDYVSGSSNCGYRRGPSSSSSSSTKRRIRWTKDLHEPFMTVVNRLGGPHKAKPKAILDMMKSDLLSITHIKSHLQKYRSTTCHHKASHERSLEEGDKTDITHELQHKIQMQIEESQQLQQEVRRSIHQQLEMQRNLQMLIEQQREQLKMMLDQHKERNKMGKKLNNP